MIGFLRGKIIFFHDAVLLLDVHDVGYEIEVLSTWSPSSHDSSELVTLFIHTYYREDAQKLYGFESHEQKNIFRRLIRINGVGPKLALAILSHFQVDMLLQCIQNQDSAQLSSVPGIGKKTASRLLVELQSLLESSSFAFDNAQLPIGNDVNVSLEGDVAQALIALGYPTQEAQQLAKKVYDPEVSTAILVKRALKLLLPVH